MHTRAAARLMALVAAGVTGLTAGAAVAFPAVAPWRTGDPTFTAPVARPGILGVNYQGTWNILTDAQRRVVLDRLAESGVGWVRMDMGWLSIQPDGPSSYSSGDIQELDNHVREIRSRGMKILAVFSHAPKWASGTSNRNGRPRDPAQYAKAAAWLARHYNGSEAPDLKIEAMELWNEPDLSHYWAPEPASTRVSDFASLIKAAGPAVKVANPDITVVVGAPSSVDTDWYTQFYKAPGVIGSYDALGVHPYQSPGDAPPETYDPKWGKYYMRHIAALASLMSNEGDPATIWATEFGWSTHENTSTTPDWARGVSESQQADYLRRAMPVLAKESRLEAAFWYSALTTSTGDVQFDNYGMLRRDLGRKPVLYAFKCAATGKCGALASSNPSSTEVVAPPTPPKATPEPTSKPAPTKVSVKARAVKGKSKIRVNVKPNRGRGHWILKVKRSKADGTWTTRTKKYRTRGATETRTINLRRGTYIVVVKAKYGYLGAQSQQVRLKR